MITSQRRNKQKNKKAYFLPKPTNTHNLVQNKPLKPTPKPKQLKKPIKYNHLHKFYNQVNLQSLINK